MTREARQTQKRLEGEIGKMLEGHSGYLYNSPNCAFCQKYGNIVTVPILAYPNLSYSYTKDCGKCPLLRGLGRRCYRDRVVRTIDDYMVNVLDDAIPGALAIYMWLEEL